MTSQIFPFQNEQVITIRYLPPGIEQNSKKSLSIPENIFPGTNLYPPSLHFRGFETKQKIVCSSIQDVSSQNQLQQPRW